MSFNGSGSFLINTAGQPVVSGTVISSTAFNALTADLATGLSTCITKDGQTTVTANIPMANYKFTGLGAGSGAADSANLSQVQSTVVKLLASVSGTDTITAVGSPTLGAYAAGQMFYFVAASANTGAVTINIDSLGAKSITRDGTTALAAGDIQSGEVCVIVYDGTQFQLVNGASQSASIVTENLTVNKATVLNESGGDNDTRIEGDTDANLFFVDASTDRVGVGTNAPGSKLDVTAANFVGGPLIGVRFNTSNARLGFNIANSNGYPYIGYNTNNASGSDTPTYDLSSQAAAQLRMDSGQFRFNIAPSGTAGNAITFTQAMVLDTSGNLGIGTGSPTSLGATTYSLSVNSTAANSTGAVVFQNSASQVARAGVLSGWMTVQDLGSANGISIDEQSNLPIRFQTNATERARITSGGFFKASDSGTYIGSTGAYHELVSSTGGATAAVYIRNTNATSPAGIDLSYSAASPNGTGNTFLYCQDSTALRMSVRSNGGIANYQANDVNLSDQRVKKDIKPLDSMWDKFKAIEIVTFKYNDQTHDDDNIGVIAQQVESVAPEFIDVDGFGETPEDGVPLKTVYTTDMYHAAIKALQEAMARIEQLEAKVAALETK